MIAIAATGFSVMRCGSSKSKDSQSTAPSGKGFSYSSTSNKGDYAEWTFTGQTLAATWQVINNTGGVDRTLTLTATCDTYNAKFNYYTCTINSGTCTLPNSSSCNEKPEGKVEMMEAPGVAIFVHPQGQDEQLHVGMLKDNSACTADISGNYIYVNTGLGRKELVGMYNSDSNFIDFTHADFLMDAGSAGAQPQVKYWSSRVKGEGTMTDGGCVSGVRTRSTDGATLRSMMTSSGVFILDLPSGMGGMVAMKQSKVATIADFANKKFSGISFPDNGDALPVSLTTGALNGSIVTIASGDMGDESMGSTIDIRPLSSAQSAAVNPKFPDFTQFTDAIGSESSSGNSLIGTYHNLAGIPGLFRLDGNVDDGRVIFVAGKFNNKVVAFGLVYNWRDASDTNPGTGAQFGKNGLYGTGNFILFER